MESEWVSVPESLFDRSPEAHKVNLNRCQEFLGDLRKREDTLKETQVQTTNDLLQIQAARRAFEKSLKELLRTEHRSFVTEKWAELLATEEEVVAGLQELKEHGGLELDQFLGELEQLQHSREYNGK